MNNVLRHMLVSKLCIQNYICRDMFQLVIKFGSYHDNTMVY
jgi:hypothetical protein